MLADQLDSTAAALTAVGADDDEGNKPQTGVMPVNSSAQVVVQPNRTIKNAPLYLSTNFDLELEF
ncbi:UNVERIFIED_ORG: hypothetical protein ABID57_003600 [Arthrobacter sp. UYEF1]